MTSRKKRNLRRVALVLIPAALIPLIAQQTSSLTIAGQAGSARVTQVRGRNYVDVEDLAHLTGASTQINGSQIVMSRVDPGHVAAAQPGFSKGFLTASIEAMAEQREWRAALTYAIQGGYPLTEAWLATFRAKAQQALQLALVAATTASDKDATSLLTGQLNNVTGLSDKYLGMARSMSYIAPNALNTDSLDQKISACNQSLASMAAANRFVDDGNCR